MEIVLALAVVIAVIIFGGLISVGNERQRRAIDNLRDQIVLWAIQDLHIKREKLTKEVRIDDPIDWLNEVASKAVGYAIQVQIIESFETPMVLECVSNNGAKRILFSPVSPREVRRLKKVKHNPISHFPRNNPLLSLPRGTEVHKISVLNAGMFFDLELQTAWQSLVRYDVGQINQLWLYLLN